MSWVRGLLTAIRFTKLHNTLSFFFKERTCAKKEKKISNDIQSIEQQNENRDGEAFDEE